MNDTMLFLVPCQLDFSELRGYFRLGLQLVIAAVGALIGWWLGGPSCRVLYRLAFQRPAPPAAIRTARFLGAFLLGILLFLYSPIGGGGDGGGTGGGTGSGTGTGKGGDGTGKGGDGTGKKPDTRPARTGEELDVEMIVSSRYQDDKRWYLLEGKEPPRTLEEIEAHLKEHRKRLREINIIIYSNSPEPEHYAVKALEALAEQYQLRSYKPKDYWTKKR